jgi:hypothetical protein
MRVAPTIISRLTEYAAPTEISANAEPPLNRSRRRPIRSPRVLDTHSP